jgi:hypothetical protein
MTPAQETALAYHCRLAGETVHPRFGRADFKAGLSAIVTVNSGYE